jgi:hypothetical protein
MRISHSETQENKVTAKVRDATIERMSKDFSQLINSFNVSMETCHQITGPLYKRIQ